MSAKFKFYYEAETRQGLKNGILEMDTDDRDRAFDAANEMLDMQDVGVLDVFVRLVAPEELEEEAC